MRFEYHRVIFHRKKLVKIFTFAYGQGRPRGLTLPHHTVSLTVKYPLSFTTRLRDMIHSDFMSFSEKIFLDGIDHQVTEMVLATVYKALADHHVFLEVENLIWKS